MKNLKDFKKSMTELKLEDTYFIVGGSNDTGYTESGQDTNNCDYYATLDGETTDCWRLDQNCCPT